jgi:hypothetical protein
MKYRLIRVATALTFAGLLAGCSMYDSAISYIRSDKPTDCPDVAILANTASLPAFGATAGGDPSDLIYRIAMTNLSSRCNYNKRETTADTRLRIFFHAQRPPGGGEASYRVPYYVAVTSDGVILDKKMYWLEFGFAEHAASSDAETVVDSTVIQYGKGKTTYDYHLLVGFQLTKAQLDYNAKMGRYEP